MCAQKSAARDSIKAGARQSPGPQMAMGRIEHTLLDEERGFLPNRPKTIACNPTIPQKVTNVSIHDKGPEPVSHGSPDPIRKPVRRARSKLQCFGGVPAPPGVVMVAPPEAPRNAERTQSEGRVV